MLDLYLLIPATALVALLVGIVMRPRRYYFIRHGETVMNATHIRQGEEGGLTEKGQHQAQKVGESLKGLHIKRIISSSYQRARETTESINEYLHVPVTYSPLFGERRNPKEIIGRSVDDPEVVRIVDQMDLAYHEDDFRISDEENFIDLKARAKKGLEFLGRQSGRNVVLVTHHHFLKMLIAYLLYRDNLHASDFVKLSFFNYSDNAAVTICEYHPWRMFGKTRGWEVVAFNEHAA